MKKREIIMDRTGLSAILGKCSTLFCGFKGFSSIKRAKDFLRMVRACLQNIQKQNDELIWAKTWDDTRRGIGWAENLPGISPGRWAVGYNYLYVMTRILSEKEPLSVLDLGLGISSTLISSYFSSKDCDMGTHTIVEQDAEWARFYMKKSKLSRFSEICLQECVEKDFGGCKYNAYKNLKEVVKGRKYTVISIDGPKGSAKHSRRDILSLLPGVLENSWVIVMDDAQRDGERATIAEIKSLLAKNTIGFCEGIYPGMTDCYVIASLDNKFLCSM